MSSDISHRIPLTMRLQPLRMRRITPPMRRWQFFPTYLKSLTPLCLFNIHFYGATIKRNGVIRQNGVWPCAKDHRHSSLRMRKITSVLNVAVNLLPPFYHRFRRPRFPVNRFKFWQSDSIYDNFSHIFTAHAQKRLFMNFGLKVWHHHSIPWPWFLYRARYFRDLRTFYVDLCIG